MPAVLYTLCLKSQFFGFRHCRIVSGPGGKRQPVPYVERSIALPAMTLAPGGQFHVFRIPSFAGRSYDPWLFLKAGARFGIIDELEDVRRGHYAGAVGYFGFNGNMDTCITIRTILMQGDVACLQAGAGIVADSEPEAEAEKYIDEEKGVLTVDEALQGARDIIAEQISEDEEARAALRRLFEEKGTLRSKVPSKI